MDADAIARVLRRVASEIVERTRGAKHLGIVGIRRGGVPISLRLADEIRRVEGRDVPVGTIDITLYRDDAATALPDPKIGPSAISFEIKSRDIVLVDDVLHTGRTVRAAIDCLLDYGRPRRVWLAVLFDRGGRELPVAPDFVGRTLEIPKKDLLDVIMDGCSEDRAIIRRERLGKTNWEVNDE
ncbi:MAG: bifunctional pyr operon transcriptional regulator/uracil phosphoribosyltransferase PyrR [Deltaproteobacteria bacterium]|nr:bifunctional pyr operon transcriptional regulator/uracil phosphoribosyltransferase PyrR [Deltaproteobacteria bacterium]